MLLIGIAFLVFAGLLQFTSVSAIMAAVIVGAVFLILGLVRGERL